MLTSLRIRNLALVEDLTVELQPGYNVITGETGTGKSILIGALNLVLGERAERTLIRSGGDSCTVEAVFDVRRLKAPLAAFLEENGVESCEEQQLVLKRTFTNAGANRQFINGSATTLNVLARVGEWLVDIHGPHEHQSLLHPARQLDMLDAFGGLEKDREGFAALVRRQSEFEAEKAALIVDDTTYARQLEMLRFQVNEISAARLLPDEERQMEADYQRADNAAKLRQLSRKALELLSENEEALLAQAGIIGRALQELQRVDAGAGPLMTLHEQAVLVLRELQAELSRYEEQVELDPAHLQELEERLGLIQSLKRKYGRTVADVITFGEEARVKLDSLEMRDSELERLNQEIRQLSVEIMRVGRVLTDKRRKFVPQLSKAVAKQLADLGFRESQFEIEMKSSSETLEGRAGQNGSAVKALESASSLRRLQGFDTVEFQFAPNPGESARPLRAIASSGELARVMLAIKTVLATEDQVPVLVFDEVDANVGGETANAVGEKMEQIARSRQVVCITHLPQVAAPASAHFVASKEVKGGRTISRISLLGREERVTEMARMLGGQRRPLDGTPRRC